MACNLTICSVDVHQLAAIVRNQIDNILILDSRSFLEYNSSHVVTAINVGCAKLMKRRLQQEKLSIQDFLAQNCHWDVDKSIDIIVYDQNSYDANSLPPDSFMAVFLQKLFPAYNSVNILKGGFLEFQASYPNLCEDEKSKIAPLTSLSQPCLPISNHGPTRILPFLYLGSQHDALNREILQKYNISYELNVSTNCPKPDFIQESHFMRIPVIDNYSEKLLPYFPKAFQFLDKVRESGGSVLVHCLAGISRSATVAIAYVMKSLKMSSDEAYRYVKAKRATISPNFNFLGQLLEYEKQLQQEASLVALPLFNASNFSEEKCRNQRNISGNQKFSQSCFNSSQQCTYKSYLSSFTKAADKSAASFSYATKTSSNESYLSNKETNFKEKFNIACVPDRQYAALSIKCIPASSLKELNFTPCQTSVQYLKLTADHRINRSTKVKSPISSSNNKDKLSFLDTSLHFVNDNKNCDLTASRNTLGNCKMEAITSFGSFSPDLPTSSELKSFEFDPKAYIRSDSLSTSGLGSEGSDCADSWNDYPSSIDKESDILMDDDYGTVPTEEDEFYKRKILELDDSYEEVLSLYPKYEPSYSIPHSRQQFLNYTTALHSENDKHDMRSGHCNENKDSADVNCLLSAQTEACVKELGKSHILYRAQSCPGMLSSDAAAPQSTSIDRLIEAGTVALRKSRSKHEKDRFRNRYSCSSLDYMDYSTNSEFAHVSCPDGIHTSSATATSSNTISAPHRNFRHSMIQVS